MPLLTVQVTQAAYDSWKAAARSRGLTLSQWVREQLGWSDGDGGSLQPSTEVAGPVRGGTGPALDGSGAGGPTGIETRTGATATVATVADSEGVTPAPESNSAAGSGVSDPGPDDAAEAALNRGRDGTRSSGRKAGYTPSSARPTAATSGTGVSKPQDGPSGTSSSHSGISRTEASGPVSAGSPAAAGTPALSRPKAPISEVSKRAGKAVQDLMEPKILAIPETRRATCNHPRSERVPRPWGTTCGACGTLLT